MSPRLAHERTIVVGVKRSRDRAHDIQDSLAELTLLIEAAGGMVVHATWQELRSVSASTLIGKGKVQEIAEAIREHDAQLVAIDEELSPSQNRNLEKAWGVRVVDRTAVILDIFALRARTREGKLQVELAQLEYLAPRLVGRGEMMSQQAGRIGTRGPGETQLEYDRRAMRRRITILKSRIVEVRRHREIHRLRPEDVPLPLVSLMGYTNAGKSTLMNRLTAAGVHVEDQLFSTLDPTVRRMRLPGGHELLLADTVGFIKRLPHQLVAAFKATFEEMAHADLLIEVVDSADPDYEGRIKVVEEVLAELGLAACPRIRVFNKCDLLECSPQQADGGAFTSPSPRLPPQGGGEKVAPRHAAGNHLVESVPHVDDAVTLSARTGEGVDALIRRMEDLLNIDFTRVTLKLGHDQGDILSTLYRVGSVIRVRHYGRTVRVECALPAKYVGKYRAFIV